jgi:hypothetical protein
LKQLLTLRPWCSTRRTLVQELLDDAVAAEQRGARVAALDTASERLRAGTYKVSSRSCLPIPNERLEADAVAALLVHEVGQHGDRGPAVAMLGDRPPRQTEHTKNGRHGRLRHGVDHRPESNR